MHSKKMIFPAISQQMLVCVPPFNVIYTECSPEVSISLWFTSFPPQPHRDAILVISSYTHIVLHKASSENESYFSPFCFTRLLWLWEILGIRCSVSF